jgi:hypothetical protein
MEDEVFFPSHEQSDGKQEFTSVSSAYFLNEMSRLVYKPDGPAVSSRSTERGGGEGGSVTLKYLQWT